MSNAEEVKKEENGAAVPEADSGHSAFIGQPPTFDHNSNEGFSFFHTRLTTFFKANDISSKDKMKAIFLTCLADKTYKMLDGLVAPETVEDVSFDDLMDKFNTFFNPKAVNAHFAARLAFYTARKKVAESYAEWAKRVEELAAECGFGAELQGLVRDMFVVGLGDANIRSRLLEEDPTSEDPTLESLVSLATTAETLRALDTSASGGNRPKCVVCGMSNHSSMDCRYKGLTCSACGEVGHIAPGCPQRVKLKSSKRQAMRKYAQNAARRYLANQGPQAQRPYPPRPFRSNYNNPY